MPDIKTRDVVKSTVKTIDKSATAAQRMKDAYIRTKRKAEHSVYSMEDSPGEYAADRVSEGTATILHEVGHQLNKQGRKGVRNTKDNISAVKEHFHRERSIDPLKKQAVRASDIPRHSAEKAPKVLRHEQKSVKQITKGAGKTARRSVKTAEKTARATIKTSQQAAKAAQRTAQAAAKASHRAPTAS